MRGLYPGLHVSRDIACTDNILAIGVPTKSCRGNYMCKVMVTRGVPDAAVVNTPMMVAVNSKAMACPLLGYGNTRTAIFGLSAHRGCLYHIIASSDNNDFQVLNGSYYSRSSALQSVGNATPAIWKNVVVGQKAQVLLVRRAHQRGTSPRR